MARKRVAVLFGGVSKDHKVSLMSAYSVLNGLNKSLYDVIPIGITTAGRWLYFPGDYSLIPSGKWEEDPDCCSAVLSPDPLHGGIIKIMSGTEGGESCSLQRIDVIFPVLNGKYGECGQIQALCKLSSISYVGSGFTAANACSDKVLTHLILNRAGIKTAKFYELERVNIDAVEGQFAEIENQINYPMYVKAAVTSRSVGANFANNRDELKAAIKLAFSHHHKILVEEAIKGKELECLVWGSVYALNVSKIAETADNFELVVPAQIDSATSARIAEISKTAFLSLGCTDFARMTFKLSDAGELYCCKVSNMPGFTENDIMARLMQESGYEYAEMLDMLLESAKEA
ncbi:MAG: ATP-grasp domain-containing protein [Oscillospiraceae bacterium]|nr:ATP-grasp domain-containing protein [Oscillospiraceae bacterium]